MYYYHTDHLGSSTFLTDESGAPRQYLLYLPFGETMLDQKAGGYDSRYKYTGKETDENTGLNYHGARYYNPSISMWYGVDPLIEDYPAWSPFNYVMGNPIRLIDPTGMSSENGGSGDDPIYVAQGPDATVTAKNGQHKMQQDGLKPLSSLNAQSIVMENRGNNKSDYPVTVNNHIEAKHYTFSELYSMAGPKLSNDLLNTKYGMDHAVKYMQHSVFSSQADLANVVNPILISVTPIPFLSFFGSGLRYSSWASKGGGRGFWSGAGSEARALQGGFQTLGQTRAGQNLIKLTEGMPYYPAMNGLPASQAYLWWARLSTQYAKSASGTVHVFQNAQQGVGMQSIWRLYEYPTLLKNPNVKAIKFHY